MHVWRRLFLVNLQFLRSLRTASARQCSEPNSLSSHQRELLRNSKCNINTSSIDLVQLLTSSLKQSVELTEQAFMEFPPPMLSNSSRACPYAAPGLGLVSACHGHANWTQVDAFSCNVSFRAMGVLPNANGTMVRDILLVNWISNIGEGEGGVLSLPSKPLHDTSAMSLMQWLPIITGALVLRQDTVLKCRHLHSRSHPWP